MRKLLVALWLLLICWSPNPTHGLAQTGGVQTIVLGDRTCADLLFDCAFPNVLAQHRYLHIVFDDAPQNEDWQVLAGPACTDSMPLIAGGQPLDDQGYGEFVVDLTALPDGLGLGPRCYVLRGRNGWAVTFYAVYFDDNPAPDVSTLYPHYQSMNGRPDLPDLDVQYIERTPLMNYDATPNQPAVGSAVTFTAHIRNAGGEAVAPFAYTWSLDGSVLARGTYGTTLEPGDTGSISIPWTWDAKPHDLTFRAEPAAPEISTTNDTLSIRTNALLLGFWVERSAYSYFNQQQWQYCQSLTCTGSDSFEDWLQRQVARWNELLRDSVYPGSAPAGIADRVQLDEFTIVPDGALPLHGGGKTYSPDLQDRSVDLEWGMPADGVEAAYPHLWEGSSDIDWAMIHELGHARYLADLYRFDVGPSDTVNVTNAAGQPVYNPADPYNPIYPLHLFSGTDDLPFLYVNEEKDLMSCTCTPFYSEYTALVLNRIQGRRATCGNTNAPCNLGEWFFDVPPVNVLRILDTDGRPVPDGTVVRLYQDTGQTYTDHAFDDSHARSLSVNHGAIQLPPDPFAVGRDGWAAGHNLLLIEVRAPHDDAFCFQEPTDFNRAYWDGYTDQAHPAQYTLRLAAIAQNACHFQLPPALVNEPFATSPVASTLNLKPASRGTAQTLTISLRDGAATEHAMAGRHLEARDAQGHQLAAGTTGAKGALTLHIPANAGGLWVDDVTDNDLRLSVLPATPAHRGVRQR